MIGRLLLMVVAVAAATVTAAPMAPLRYPSARLGDTIDSYHGVAVVDPYRWLEDTDAEETKEWVRQENELSSAYLNALPERAGFRARLTSLLDFERFSAPNFVGGRYFFLRNTGLQNQGVLLTAAELHGEPQVLLDPNTLALDGTVALVGYSVSRDGAFLAYTLAASGSVWAALGGVEVASGRVRPEVLTRLKFTNASWTGDNAGFFYERFPEPDPGQDPSALRNQKLFYHRLGDDPKSDRVVLEMPDHPDTLFEASTSKDGRYLMVRVEHGADNHNLLYVKDLGGDRAPDLDGPFLRIVDRFEAEYRPLGVVDGRLYVLTNHDASRSKVVTADLTGPGVPLCEDLVPEGQDNLEGASLAGGTLLLRYLTDAKSRLQVVRLDGEPVKEIPLPTLGTVREVSTDPDRAELFYGFTSFLYPTTVFRYDLQTGEQTTFHPPKVDLDPTEYDVRQVFFRSKDGTRVPMFIIARRGLPRDGNRPTNLSAYGGFNISRTPEFSASLVSWLEKGGVVAAPNLRGGGEYGQAWHLAGTKERKQNVFDDFFAAAETLVAEKYTRPARLGIVGGSNGGLLIGAAITQRPELFGAAVPRVGVLDMLRYHRWTIGWAWEPDYGTSDDPVAFAYLRRYSPLHNVKPGTCYPPTLITTADHDDRVVPGHSFKFAATLQAAQGCDHPVLIRIDTKAGHGGGKPLSKVIEEESDVLSFLWHELGATDGSSGALGGAEVKS